MKKIQILFILAITLVPNFIHAQAEELEPVIIVPGIVGSWNSDVILGDKSGDEGEWNFLSFDHTWDKMILNLEIAGYERDKNLFVAFYDWRQSNINSAIDYLIPTIEKALVNSPTGKVNIVAHSMGGLLARSYIQSDDYRGDVNKLVMLGTPNRGSSDVYVIWAGGEIPEGWTMIQETIAGRYLDFLAIKTPEVTNDLEAVRTFIPSIRELLPLYDFLEDSDGLKSYYSLDDTRNLFLENLSDTANGLVHLGGIVVIAGTSTPTIATIPVVEWEESDGELWKDGKPDPIDPIPNTLEGDNRVLTYSSILERYDIDAPVLALNPNIFQKIFAWFTPTVYAQEEIDWETFLITKVIDSNHGSLPTLAIKDVFEALGLNPDPIPNYAPLAEADNIVSFWFASPVQVKVTDPQGRIITKDSNEIPNAVYDGETDPNGVKMVMIENALPGEYKLELTGSGDGEYHILSSVTTEDFDETTITEGNITAGEVHEYTAEIDTESSVAPEISEPVITPPSSGEDDNDENLCSFEYLFTKIKERIESSHLNKRAKKNLLKRLENLEEKLERNGKNREKLCEIFKKHAERRDHRGRLLNMSEHDFSSFFEEFENHSERREKVLEGVRNLLENLFRR